MMAGGVPFGASSPCHVRTSKPGTVSAMVANSGVAGTRCRLVTAIARSLPARTSGNAVGMVLSDNCTWPPTVSMRAKVLPL